MKKICEIYDISKEYEMSENEILIVVSDVEREKVFSAVPELKKYESTFMSSDEWQSFLDIYSSYQRNENKFYMREVRQSQKTEISNSFYLQDNEISSAFENKELSDRIDYALSFLKDQSKRRFLLHYVDRLTYRQIAEKENRSVSAIFESVKAAEKIFLKNFRDYPEQNTLNKCK